MRSMLLNLVLTHIKLSADSSTSLGNGVCPCKTSSGLENSSWLMRATSGVGVPVTHSQLSLGKSLQRSHCPVSQTQASIPAEFHSRPYAM